MSPDRPNHKLAVRLAIGVVGFLAAVGFGLWGLNSVLAQHGGWQAALQDPMLLQRALQGRPDAWLVYIGIQAVQVVLAPIPGEFSGYVAGVLFGYWHGIVLASIGLALGSALAFGLGRWAGRPFVEWLVPAEKLERFEFLKHRRGLSLLFVVFLIPGFPKDILTYLFSLSPIGFWRFFVISQLGRFPGTVALIFTGAAMTEARWEIVAIAVGATVAFLVAIAVWRRPLWRWLQYEPPAERSPAE